MYMNNTVSITGNLTRDVELKKSKGGKSFARVLIAVNRGFKKEKGGESRGAEFLPVVIWDKQAENAAKYLGKGSKVSIMGSLRGSFFEVTVDGQAKTRLDVEVVANQIQYFTWKQEEGQAAAGGRGKG
ncbi:MAG: single-stranded DNA-binding protein [Candidatus Dormibacteraceae bacterium]